MTKVRSWVALLLCVGSVLAIDARGQGLNQPPPGFTALFNGTDLTGWRGRKPNFNPADEQRTFSKAEVAALQSVWNAERDRHWRVDVAAGEIVSDGSDPHLATVADYGDFELLVDWRMVSPNGDSGIYLRGYPQVQIWDPSNPREQRNGADRGSGALWNNNKDNPGRFPLVKADRPIGEWNTLRITMTGQRVSVWLNGQQTVADQVMDNFFDPSVPHTRPLGARGPIELQTHGSEMRFRNIFIRELAPASSR